MCVLIYYAYSILSNFQEKLETLVKFIVILLVTIVLVCTRIRKKIVLILTNTSTCIHTRIHKKYFFLAFVYRLLEIFTQKYVHYVLRMNIFKYSQTYIHNLIFTMQTSQAEICKEMPAFSQLIYTI